MTLPSRPANVSVGYNALTDATGTSTPTLRVNAGGAAAGQSLKSFTATVALSTTAGTTAPIETVTAGKTLFLTDIYVTGNTAQQFLVQIVVGGTVTASAVTGGTVIFSGYAKGDTSPISLMGIETQPSATAGQVVTLVLGQVGAATSAAFYIAGFEQ